MEVLKVIGIKLMRAFFSVLVVIVFLFFPLIVLIKWIYKKSKKQELVINLREDYFNLKFVYFFVSIITIFYLLILMIYQVVTSIIISFGLLIQKIKVFEKVGEKIDTFGSMIRYDWIDTYKLPTRNFIEAFVVNSWFGLSAKAQNNRVFVYFLFPSLGAFSLFVGFPFFHGFYLSFTNWTGLNTGSEVFSGLLNYQAIIGDYAFAYSFYRTALYSGLNIVAINIVAFLLALLVTQKLKLTNIYRAAFFIPNLIGGLVLGYIWQFIYNEALIQFMNPSLIASGRTSLTGLVIVVTWQYAGYIMMIYIAALQNVPQDLLEASKIDGASAIQRLRHVVFPLIAQAFTIAMFLTLVTSFKQFDTIVSLGSPATNLPLWISNIFGSGERTVRSLNLVAVNIYNEAFVNNNMGLGQAKAIVFFIALLIFSLVQVYYNKKKEIEL
jgi:raffinose/stachyose/melibiose transport system permease protein